ncbi:hypothetical protein [Candidatus Pelagisphaera phototrophica]|uniref:hypothetical protein n=1 Tax=Candidatus Pelagisphaera phototrophica TaxID=2684113 RepID=UPI001A0BE09F|nr:hypothetical protein [Candidatus Pelagisphaera phototrophica]QXD33587.1 hypothetical protein GA004_07815 [Candidatus Pelagisphaera phototrophica]|tara:strand:- start:65 stop:316 length:252 start_codon:yes stop_codon:yes gene_type:complete
MQKVPRWQPFLLLPWLLEKLSLQTGEEFQSSSVGRKVYARTELAPACQIQDARNVASHSNGGRFSIDFQNPNPSFTDCDGLVV